MKKFLSISLAMVILVLSFSKASHLVAGASVEECQQTLNIRFQQLIGPGKDLGPGYLRQLSDTLSTQLDPSALTAQIRQLSRNARLELMGICDDLAADVSGDQFFPEAVLQAYQLQSCTQLGNVSAEDYSSTQDIVGYCRIEADKTLDRFNKSLRLYVVRHSFRTAFTALQNRLKALNGRLGILSKDISRWVGVLYTFSFRLGGAITGHVD